MTGLELPYLKKTNGMGEGGRCLWSCDTAEVSLKWLSHVSRMEKAGPGLHLKVELAESHVTRHCKRRQRLCQHRHESSPWPAMLGSETFSGS